MARSSLARINMEQKLLFKCACCGFVRERYSESVLLGLGQFVCLDCEVEREYEIDAMMSARHNYEGNDYELR